MEAARITWRPLGRLLVEQGLLSDDELEHALAQQQVTGKRLGETIVELRFVSGPDLASALATQYGIVLTVETGFGTGLRAEIQRRHENDRGLPPQPPLRVVEAPSAEPDEVAPDVAVDQPEADGAAEALLLAQLEEQWARLAAAEAALIESERAIRDLKSERDQLLTAAAPGEPAINQTVEALVEPDLVTAAVVAPPEPRPVVLATPPGPEHPPAVEELEPVLGVVSTLPFHVQPQEWKLAELERLAHDVAGSDPVRSEELSYLLLHLQEFASNGVLPVGFDALVRESFG